MIIFILKCIVNEGHYDCGAVKAASGHQDLGMLEHWLRQIRDVRRLHNDYLDEIEVKRIVM